MSRFFHGAALTAAAAVAGLSSAFSRSLTSSFPLAASPSSPSTPIGPVATSGHLALVRAHPGLRELDAMLTPGSFLVDATQAFLAVALGCLPTIPDTLRKSRDFHTALISREGRLEDAEMEKGQAAVARTIIALVDAREGRLEDARDAFVRLAAERPFESTLRLFAAALCHVLGHHEEGGQWLHDSAVPDLSRLDHKNQFAQAVLAATIGSAPRAVVGSEELVLVSALGLLERSMWSIFTHGDLPARLHVLAFMAFLRGVVARKLHRDDATPN
jgi:hypothetical protein